MELGLQCVYILPILEQTMAFAIRSPKKSPFDPVLHLPEIRESHNYQIGSPDQRIHHGCTDGKIIRARKEGKQNSQKKEKSIGSMHGNVLLETKKKRGYDFRCIQRSRPKYQACQSSDESTSEDKKQYYNLPGSLSSKSLVKYTNPVPKPKLTSPQAETTPGPGAYTPEQPTSTHTPIFHEPFNPGSASFRSQYAQQNEAQPEQNLFAVKYKYMNSSSFKKCLDLVKVSNRMLMAKLLCQRKGDMKEKENEDYVQVEPCAPGPGTYNGSVEKGTKNVKNGVSFGNAKRFVHKLSQGSVNYYNPSPTFPKQDNNETSCFCSQSVRFEEIKSDPTSLQYANHCNSFLKASKNRKQVGFESKILRGEEREIDDRPFYGGQPMGKKEFMAKFGKFSGRDRLFDVNRETSPGPENYNTSPSWHKEHSCLIKDDTYCQPNQSISQNEPLASNFYLCSLTNLHKPSPKLRKGQLKSQALSPSPTPISPTPCPQKALNTRPQWQSRSFNVLFTNELLPANNPIKNRIL